MARKTTETPAGVEQQQTGQAVEQVADLPDHGEVMKQVLTGNLASLTPQQQAEYLVATCRSLGLNPLTSPLAILTDRRGKTFLYAKKDASEQLRRLYGISIFIVDRQILDDLYVVTARAALNNGRTDENVGVVSLRGLSGEDRANAIMKAHTKAVRRVTLSICGLGCLDESEVVEMPTQQPPALNGTPASVPQPLPTPQPQQPVAPQPAELKPAPMNDGQANRIDELVKALGLTAEQVAKRLVQKYGNGDWHQLTEAQAAEVIVSMEAALNKKGGS